MARYQIILSYDGTGFFGSQRQGSKRTVQAELEKALTKIDWKGRSILLAGRTDTGVHASGQVAAFDLDWIHGLERLHQAINTNLPDDIAVGSIKSVSETFHPRFDATSRSYRYRLFCEKVRDPLRERYAWRIWPPVSDLTCLAKPWLGTHDFSSYGSATSIKGTTIRSVVSANWMRSGDEWIFNIIADAFLYRMVRRLVYVQVAAGQGRTDEAILIKALDGAPEEREIARKKLPPGLALPNGLILENVTYDNMQ